MAAAARIAEHHEGWAGPWVEDEIFGTHDPAAVAAELDAFCARELGSAPARCSFYEASVGCVAGFALEDGRRVVAKAHRPGEPPADYLAAAQTVQRTLADRGFPCPRPLLGARPFGRGLATVEEELSLGKRADAHDPVIRGVLARTLARLVEVGSDLIDVPGLRRGLMSRPADLWPRPHSPIFDFEATAQGAEWIDDVAREAREELGSAAGEPVLGHVDWSVKHFRFEGSQVTAVYDWDSVAVDLEPILVGEAARSFTATWYLDVRIMPSPDEAAAFVREYEEARGRQFTPAEQRTLRAAALYATAYTARCEHAGDPRNDGFPPGSARETLRRYASNFLELT